MMEVGRLCMKIAGRDANRMCVVVEVLDNNHVLIDGETRRKKCNIKHLEPTSKVLKIKSGAVREDVKKVFNDLGLGFFEPKSKSPEPRVRKVKAKREVVEKPKREKSVKKAEVKADAKVEAKPKLEAKTDMPAADVKSDDVSKK